MKNQKEPFFLVTHIIIQIDIEWFRVGVVLGNINERKDRGGVGLGAKQSEGLRTVWTVVMNEIDEVWERKKNDKTVLLYLLQNLTQNISKIYFILQNILIFIKKIKLKFV